MELVIIIFLIIIFVLYVSNQEKKAKEQEEWEIKQFEKKLTIVRKHLPTLARKKEILVVKDDYGNEDNKKWFKEVDNFIKSTIDSSWVCDDYGVKLHNTITNLVYDYQVNYTENNSPDDLIFDKNMNPTEYEYFCRDLLISNGWDAKVTQATGDQGVDILATKHDISIAVQCKLYSKPVGNKAVQEIFTAKQHYNVNIAIVVSNNTFTRSAKELANTTNVYLMHHDELRSIEITVTEED